MAAVRTKKRIKKKKVFVSSMHYKPRWDSIEEWREEWNVPDWTNLGEYPKDLSQDQIKWEFLRRNYDYRSWWDSHKKYWMLGLLSKKTNMRI